MVWKPPDLPVFIQAVGSLVGDDCTEGVIIGDFTGVHPGNNLHGFDHPAKSRFLKV